MILYQIQTKYRDEARPRSGVLRGREFQMKDSYSFDTDRRGPGRVLRAAPRGVLRRSSSASASTTASSPRSPGAMGGSASEEFLAPAAAGEDTFVDCPACDYAANTEAVTFEPTAGRRLRARPALEELDTPDTPTIETLAAHLGVPASATLKNLLVKVDGEIVAVGVPGDREVDLGKLGEHLAPAVVELVTAEDFAGRPDLVRGYVGPQGLEKVRYIADPRVAPGTAWVTGANKPDTHAQQRGLRAATSRSTSTSTSSSSRTGDPCPNCGTGLKLDRAIEIGHIFQLGRKYADAFQLDVLGQNGKPVRVTMGSYGIGVSRAVAALAEQTADEQGPVLAARDRPGRRPRRRRGQGPPDRAGRSTSPRSWRAAGLRVLVDDRAGVSPGVKFTDAELIGVPQILVAGRRSAEGVVELKDRRTGEREELTVDEAIARLRAA